MTELLETFIPMAIPLLIEVVLPIFIIYKLYQNYNAVKYYVKFSFYTLALTMTALIFTPYFLLRPRNPLNLLAPAAILRNVSRMFGLKWTIRGAEHIRKDQAAIIVSNHQSMIDILGMFEVWPIAYRLTVIARMLLLFAGPFGFGGWLAGLIFINKDAKDKGKSTLNGAINKIKKDKIKLWIFPEGYRNPGIDEFKKGAFHMAVKGQIPIVPVVFSSYQTFLNDKEKMFNSGDVIIEALPEIPTKGMNASDIDYLIKITRNEMIKKFDSLNEEIAKFVKE